MSVREMKHELHVAAVYASDGIRLLTASRSREAVTECLAAYVHSQVDMLLWPADALRVRALLGAGEAEEAVAQYFARVGERWEREQLRRETVASGSADTR